MKQVTIIHAGSGGLIAPRSYAILLAEEVMSPVSSLYLLTSFVIGIWSAFVLPFGLQGWSRVLIGPALGMILVGETTFLLSLLIDLNGASLAGGSILVVLVLLWLHRKEGLLLLDRRKPAEYWRGLVHSWPAWVIFLTIGLVVIYIYATRVMAPGANGILIARGGLYGDTAFHNSQITGFAFQGVPIQNPTFAGIPLRYPFLVNFYAACLIKLGMSLRAASVLPQIFNFLAFVISFHLLARKITTNRGVFFSFLILFLGWGLGFAEYIKDVSVSGSWTITKDYTNDMQLFRLQNIITALLLPQRGLLSGLFLGLLVAVGFVHLENEQPINRRQGLWLGLLLGMMPLWHAHSFLFIAFSALFWCAIRYRKNWKRNRDGLLIFGFVSLALALPFLLWFREQIGPSMRWQWGWTQPDVNILVFWIANTGLLIPLALFSLKQRTVRSYGYLLLPAGLIFIVANVIVFQPWDWDNVKLLVWVFLFASIFAGTFLDAIFSRGFGFKILSVAVLVTLTASGTLSILRLLSPEYVYTMYDTQDLDLAEWVKKNTSPFSTFLISDAPAHPVTGLAGRTAYLGYPGHVWSHGIDYRPRLAVEKRILNGDLSALRDLEIPIDYIVAEASTPLFKQHGDLPVSYKNAKYTVFRTYQ